LGIYCLHVSAVQEEELHVRGKALVGGKDEGSDAGGVGFVEDLVFVMGKELGKLEGGGGREKEEEGGGGRRRKEEEGGRRSFTEEVKPL
jgi:hypothetical protein